ncbi:malonyl-CoA decarboxylase [Amylibacter sp. SFDW26]|uniref:malonyl-CoA decarboxylase domain-containing protein n=1 Tax=Amylibacter sp. SFDW26 TaxID=2652722 RepID=UPI001261FB6C|nr:malonyl-CoA decarboxylase family protein [Amylibacter sp. SFDW26]KAB7616013.1 malonyl-CoA decarboxylase [Amylibacter sp. SFDW26]
MALTLPINDFLSTVADRGRSLIGLPVLSKQGDVGGTVILCLRLLQSKGMASGLALSQQILSSYETFNTEHKLEFFEALFQKLACDTGDISQAAATFLENKSQKNLKKLSKATKPQYATLISLLNQSPASTMKLLNMRSDLLGMLRDTPELKALDEEFVAVFSAWFNRGFLGLRNIDWHTSPTILENIIKYEAVHGISDWDDLSRRIKPADRMIYGFFHPNLEDEPLIFVEVALMDTMPDAIAPVLTKDRTPLDPRKATTAVFYSISNCQNGLRGIPLGNFLIKQVVEDVKSRFPNLKDFVTLSPVLKFGDWMRAQKDDVNILPQELTAIDAVTKDDQASLLSAAAYFLSNEKARDNKPVDPVCRFHIGNGARLERLNWAARIDDIGFDSSFTIMANYRYIIDDIEKNHEAFESEGTVTLSNGVKKIANLDKS